MKKMFLILASAVVSLTACSKDSGDDDSPPIEKQQWGDTWIFRNVHF